MALGIIAGSDAVDTAHTGAASMSEASGVMGGPQYVVDAVVARRVAFERSGGQGGEGIEKGRHAIVVGVSATPRVHRANPDDDNGHHTAICVAGVW